MPWFCFSPPIKPIGPLPHNILRPFHKTGGVVGHHFTWKKSSAKIISTKAKIATGLVCIFIPTISAMIPSIWLPSNPIPIVRNIINPNIITISEPVGLLLFLPALIVLGIIRFKKLKQT